MKRVLPVDEVKYAKKYVSYSISRQRIKTRFKVIFPLHLLDNAKLSLII